MAKPKAVDVADRKRLLALGQTAVKKAFRGQPTGLAKSEYEFPSVFASTGSLSLDRLFAGRNPGGAPIGKRFGRVIHLAGEWSTAKSLVLDHMFKDVVVNLGGLAKRTETEGSADPHFANAIGLPLDLLSVDRPDSFEKAFDMFIEWHDAIRKEDEEIPIIWGFDSIATTEADKAANQGLSESGGWHFGGGKAEALGAGLSKIVKLCSRYPTTLVLINQTRDNVGQMFGPKKRTPGGHAPHFYASLEIWLSGAPRPGGGFIRSTVPQPELTKETIKRLGLYDLEKTAVVGRYIRAKCTKTKMSTTLETTADFYVDFRKGVHKWEGLIERLVFEGRVKPNENMTEFEMGGKAYENRKALINFLNRNPDVLAEGQRDEDLPDETLPDTEATA